MKRKMLNPTKRTESYGIETYLKHPFDVKISASRISRDVISGGLKPPNNFDAIEKIFYVNHTAFRRSENASTSITTW